LVCHSVAPETRVGELDRYSLSRRIVSQALIWATEHQTGSDIHALSILGLNTLQMVSRREFLDELSLTFFTCLQFANIMVTRPVKLAASSSDPAEALRHISGLISTTSQVPSDRANALFLPYLEKACQIHQPSGKSGVLRAGQIWILLGQALVSSFVPDVPLDPKAQQSSTVST
jgi:hypothetical protein